MDRSLTLPSLKRIALAILALGLFIPVPALAQMDIPALSWTQRSDWINVRSAPYNAVGDGVADDTAAIQAALTVGGAPYSTKRTVYVPPGTYKITQTLNWQGTNTPWTYGAAGVTLIGCGRNTKIIWSGSSGGAMFISSGVTRSRFIGISWDGNNLAGAAYAHVSTHLYESRMRHENEAFRNFTATGTYVPGVTYPPCALITGLFSETTPTAETLVWNCLFNNCTYGVMVGYEVYNSYQWFVEGCEFENCGTGVAAWDGKTIIYNNHFEGSTVADIATTAGLDQTVARCTSHGSNAFFTVSQGGSATPQVLQDCWIDSWTSITGAVEIDSRGPALLFDCVFSNPPNTASPIRLNNSPNCPARLLLSNNSFPPTITAPVDPGPISVTVTVPPGNLGGTVTLLSSATTTFLQTTWPPESTNIIDVTLPPYNAKKDGSVDVSGTIQSAINAARNANNGSIVYLPVGTYKIGSTLSVTGSNYTFQGSGNQTILTWSGSDNQTVMAVTSPHNISLEQFQVYGNPTVTGVRQTATTAGDITYDGVYYSNYNGYNLDGGGIQLVSLPAGSRVFLEHIDSPLTVTDCGPAEIFGKWVIQGRLIVNGATQPKTGFLGISNFQGGQMTADPNYWDILVDDNQDLVIGHIYQEQGFNHLKVNRGSGTGSGRVSIKGVKQNLTTGYTSVLVNNYQGRVLYGPQAFANADPTVITHTGSNAVDLIFPGDVFGSAVPTITTDTGCNFISSQNIITTATVTYPADALPADAMNSIAAGFDHYRQLNAEDAKFLYGILNTITNCFFETDTLNSSSLTSLGTAPTSWMVTGGTAVGSGVRAVSVTGTGSPFASGTQSAAFVDTTGTGAGSPLSFQQTTATLSSSAGAVLSFDFLLNSMTSLNDAVNISVLAGASPVFSVNLSASGSSGFLGSAPLALNTWYRVRAVIPPPASSTGTVLYTVTPWTINGPGSTSTYAAPGISGTSNQGLSSISFVQATAGHNTNINFDNITLVTGDPLVIAMPAVTITTQPQDTAVRIGQTATFSVAATGSSAVTYQWLKNGDAILGATSASYTSPAAVVGDNGTAFSVVVTSDGGSVTSETATLSVFSPPIFEADLSGTGGGTGGANDMASIGGTGTVGASSQTTYTIMSASSMGQGEYLNIAVSGTASGGKIVSQFTPATSANSWAALTGTMTSGSTSYTTLNGGFDLFVRPNTTGSNYPGWFRPVDFDSRSGTSGLRITLTGAGTSSLQFQLGSNSSIAFGSNGVTWNSSNESVTPAYSFVPGAVNHIAFTLSTDAATGLVTASLYAVGGGTAIDTASSANLIGRITFYANASVIGPNALGSGAWSMVLNTNGTATNVDYDTVRLYSTSPGVFPAIGATLPTGTAPTITTPPQSTSVLAGQAAIFTVVASGAPAPAYQWQQNGIPIVGATSATYTTPVTALTDNGTTFSAVLSNTAGSVTSATATLTVNPSYTSWQCTHFTTAELAIPSISGLSANPAGDGMSNLMKYALNLDPKLPNSSSAPTCSTVIVGGTTYLYLTHRVNRIASDVFYHYEQSTGLTSWTPITPEVFSSVHLDAATDSVTVRAPAPANTSRFFMHLRVDQ